jgi:hypothetical protein
MSDYTGNGNISWREVSARSPCAICGKPGWCSYSEDGRFAACRREAAHSQFGPGKEKKDRNGDTYWTYCLRPGERNGERWDPPRYSLADGKGERADPDTLHKVYTALLAHKAFRLWGKHSEALFRRGLLIGTPQMEYRTNPDKGRAVAVRELIKAGMEPLLPKVPGFFVQHRDDGSSYWTLSGAVGTLIPIRDVQGRIVALSVRRDEDTGGGKYQYISSKKKGGVGPGSPIHIPRFTGDKTTVRVTEGALKANVATTLSGVLTIGLPGVNAWKRAARVLKELGAKTARVAYDADACHNRHVANALFHLVHHLLKRGFVVEMESWDEEDAKGIDDLLAAKKAPDVLTGEAVTTAVESIKAAAEAANPPPAGNRAGTRSPNDNRRDIVITTDEHIVNAEAVAALANDPTVYQRGGQLVRVVRDVSPAARGIRRPAAPRIDALPVAMLRERFTAVARWVEVQSQGKDKPPQEVPAHPPEWSVKAVHTRAEWPGVRHLEAVIEYPIIRPNGTLLVTPGYDAETGLLLEPRGELPTLAESPTLEDVKAALGTLLDVICDFPFEHPAHRAAWLAALLTPLARFMFEGPAPLFLVDANVRGAGKGLLLDGISHVVSGERFTIATYTNDDDELRKRITALAVAGDRLVLFDNLDGKFGGAALDAALTATSWRDRMLGESRMVGAPLYMTWYATGNNVAVAADTARRVCPIRIEVPDERPEERADFRYPNLLQHVAANRGRLLAAALTILRAYHVAGRPKQPMRTWGSYEAWSDIVRGAVIWAGLPDPAEARLQLQQQSDVVAECMGALLVGWSRLDPGRHGLTAAEVIDRLFHREGAAPDWCADMRAAVESLVGRADSRALGYKLRLYRRRVFGGLFLDRAGTAHQAARWTVYPATAFHPDCHNEGRMGEDGEDVYPNPARAGTHARDEEIF